MALTPVVARDGNNAPQNMDAFQDFNGYNVPAISLDSTRATYRASANFTPLSTSAVTLITVTGSATKTVRITKIGMAGVSTANAQSVLKLIRTSALGTGGTGVAPTVSLLDRGASAGYPAGTAVVTHYTTGAQSSGTTTGFGSLSTFSLQTCVVAVPTVSIGQMQAVWPEFGDPINSSPIVLRGATDYLEIQNVTPANLSTATVIAYFVEWIEDGS